MSVGVLVLIAHWMHPRAPLPRASQLPWGTWYLFGARPLVRFCELPHQLACRAAGCVRRGGKRRARRSRAQLGEEHGRAQVGMSVGVLVLIAHWMHRRAPLPGAIPLPWNTWYLFGARPLMRFRALPHQLACRTAGCVRRGGKGRARRRRAQLGEGHRRAQVGMGMGVLVLIAHRMHRQAPLPRAIPLPWDTCCLFGARPCMRVHIGLSIETAPRPGCGQ